MRRDELWLNEFGDVDTAIDFAGKRIDRYEHGKTTAYAWNMDHILPISKHGIDDETNKQIVNHKTNNIKGDKTTFEIDGIMYQVVKKEKAIEKNLASYDYSNKIYCVVMVKKEY